MKDSGKRLSVSKKYDTSYCIPLWLRDEQIRKSIERVSRRIDKVPPRSDIAAVVCFGPSLNKTWEQIKGYKYIFSGSGSHKFLLERGIVPTWHVDVDPRPHKTELMGTPHPDVEYLAASTCCPAYFDHLEKHLGPEKFKERVSLWHIFDGTEEGLRALPKEEWAITGGSNVGLRQISLAAFLGFREIHIFGLDGCIDGDQSHAAAHPNSPPAYAVTKYKDKEYRTTQGYLECAKQTFHELNMLKAWCSSIEVRFFGEGLVQDMAKDYKPEPPPAGVTAFVGYAKNATITPEYLALQKQLHSDNLAYGVGGGKYADTVRKLKETTKAASVLDYGCGKGYLAKALEFPIWEYDPAIPGKEAEPRPADLVFCNDVLEHIEPDKIDFVLDDLRRVTKSVGYFIIHTGPAQKVLADGRNAHILQQPMIWWKGKLAAYFTVAKIFEVGPLVHAIVGPHGKRAHKRKAAMA